MLSSSLDSPCQDKVAGGGTGAGHQKLTIFCLHHHESHRNFWYIVGIPTPGFCTWDWRRDETSRQCAEDDLQRKKNMLWFASYECRWQEAKNAGAERVRARVSEREGSEGWEDLDLILQLSAKLMQRPKTA